MDSALKLYPISTFGRRCSLDRKTLIYYDRIGLLHPAVVKENGYRFYSSSQVHQVCLINTLKELGMSLSEVHEFISQQSKKASLSTLEAQEFLLRKKSHHLESALDMLQARKRALQLSEGCTLYQPAIQHFETRYLYVSEPLVIYKDDVALDSPAWESFYSHCAKEGVSQSYLIGFLLDEAQLQNENYNQASHFAFHVAEERFSNYQLPKGQYAVMYCNHYYGDTPTYHKLMTFIHHSGYQICGNSYEENILDDYFDIDPESFITMLSIPVKPI